jgi:hypothetical protein
MNKTMLAIIVCSTFALPANADTISGGKITSLDACGTGFSYSKKKKHWRFRITDKTVKERRRMRETAGPPRSPQSSLQ